jgi:hypothetical protein
LPLQRQTAATGVGFELAAVADEAVPWGAWPVRLRQHDARHFFDAAAGHCDDANASDASGSDDTDDDALVANSSSTAAEVTATKVQTASADGTQYSNPRTVVLKEATHRPAVVKRYLPKQGGGWKQAAVYRCDESAVNSSARNRSSSSSSRKSIKAVASSAGGAADSGNTATASDCGSDAGTAAATTAARRRKRKRSHRTEHKQQQRARSDSSDDDSAAENNTSRDSRSTGSSGSESGDSSDDDNSSSSSSSGEESASPDADATAGACAASTATTASGTAAAAAAAHKSQQQQQHVPPLPLRALLRKGWQREVNSAQAVAYPAGIQLAAAPAAGSVLESALLSELEGTIEAVLWLVMTNWQQQTAATTGKSPQLTVPFTLMRMQLSYLYHSLTSNSMLAAAYQHTMLTELSVRIGTLLVRSPVRILLRFVMHHLPDARCNRRSERGQIHTIVDNQQSRTLTFTPL